MHGGGKRKPKLCCDPRCQANPKGANAKQAKLGGHCVAHGGGLRCKHPACVADPEGGSAARVGSNFCKRHGGGHRCQHRDCVSDPKGGKSAEGRTDFCVAHGGGNRCQHADCVSDPKGGKGAEAGTDFCVAHGGGHRCKHPVCVSDPNGGKKAQGGTDLCKAHGGGHRCQHPDCVAEPDGGTSARSGTDFCIAHGGGARCPNCIDWIDSRCGKPKYDGYCATCFKRVFPDDPRSKVIYEHTKEIAVRNMINEHFDGFIHDLKLPMWLGSGCDCAHKRRVDHRKLIGGVMMAVETDENAHRYYNKTDEEIRYDDLVMYHTGKWVFIRFNPDDCFSGKGVDMEDKLAALRSEMAAQIERIDSGSVDASNTLVDIIKIYY